MFLEKRLNENKLLDELKLGNEKALLQLYKDNYSMIRNYIMRNSGQEGDVDDILQEAVIVVWEKVKEKDFKLTSKLSTFLMAISKNLWLKKLNKDSRIQYEDQNTSFNIISQRFEFNNEKLEVVNEMFSKIDNTCKQILTLFYFKEVETKEIAKLMNFANANVVKSKKYQCLKKMQTLIKEEYNSSDFF